MSKFVQRTVRVAAVTGIAFASLAGFAKPAFAGGNCEPGDVGCNQTGGEVCVTVAGRPPGGGYVYHEMCIDGTTDWDHETPSCHDVDPNCKGATKPTRQPVTIGIHR